MAIADQFVANKSEFTIVAITPFIVITSVLLILIPFVSHYWMLTILGTILAHTSMCSGNFALLSFF